MRSRTSTNPKTHHHFSVFFATPRRPVLAFEFGTHTIFGLAGLMAERGASQPTHLFNQKFLHLTGGL
jgi:hypothetical protein